jgi:hypothetical protein
MSSSVMTVTLAGSRRISSGKRGAVITTEASCAKQVAQKPRLAITDRMENLPGVFPDT